MNIADIQSLYDYNRWANDRIFLVLGKITNEQFSTPVTSSFASLQKTTFHILCAEWI